MPGRTALRKPELDTCPPPGCRLDVTPPGHGLHSFLDAEEPKSLTVGAGLRLTRIEAYTIIFHGDDPLLCVTFLEGNHCLGHPCMFHYIDEELSDSLKQVVGLVFFKLWDIGGMYATVHSKSLVCELLGQPFHGWHKAEIM